MNYSPFRHCGSIFVKKRPVHLTFFLTKRCNAKCPFCFYLSRKNKDLDNDPELSLKEIQKMSASMGTLLWLAFSGGEIFLRKDLAEVVQIFYKQNKPAIILLPTNGLLPDTIYEKTLTILDNSPASVVTVKLSLDGIGADHDKLRGVPGAFEKTLATYTLLADLVAKYDNFELGMNTVFCAPNQDGMEELISFVNSLEAVKTHTVSLVRGSVHDMELKTVDMGKYSKVISLLESNLKDDQASHYRFNGSKVKSAQDILQRRLIHKTKRAKEQVVPCFAGRLSLVVTETGDVYPCESFERKIGNVRESGYDLRQIVSSEKGTEVLTAIQRKKCYCTHECSMMMNILFNPRMYPALFKEYMAIKGWV